MPIEAGTQLGPYTIVSRIGAGGMGEVWRATDTRLDRSVAIKVLPEALAQDEQFRARFEREARTISSLNHPHICTLYDVGHENGAHFLVMELIEGESLADRIEKGPLPPDQVIRFGAEIAEALDRAHRQGVIHRDVKPGNVMLTKSGAKLLDFGLARAGAEASPLHGITEMPTQAKPLTQEGMILGTFQYMAPEQLEGQEADPRHRYLRSWRAPLRDGDRKTCVRGFHSDEPDCCDRFLPSHADLPGRSDDAPRAGSRRAQVSREGPR